MKQVRYCFYGALALAVVAPVIGCLLVGAWPAALALAAVGGGWLFAHQRDRGKEEAFFAVYLALTVWAGYEQVGAGWLLAGATTALMTWDLHGFGRRLTAVPHIAGEAVLVQTHLRRLVLVGGIALCGGGAALLVHINLTFSAAFVLSIFAMWALNQAIRQSTRE